VRKNLVEQDYIDCIVQLTGQLFANTQIPCGLWFLSKNRSGTHGFRKRNGEILFIDGRKLGALIPGSRKQKQLTEDEIERIAAVYRQFKHEGIRQEVPGFCKAASIADLKNHNYALTPGRYVGSPDAEEDEEPFEERFPKLVSQLYQQFGKSAELELTIRRNLDRLSNRS